MVNREKKKNEKYNKRERLMWLPDKISDTKVFTVIYSIFAVAFFWLVNKLMQMVVNLPSAFVITEDGVTPSLKAPENNAMFPMPFWFYGLLVVVLIIGYLRFAYKIKISYEQLNIGQKGTSRWTTREELEAQYRAIPERAIEFSGGGGVPIARIDDKIYIDDSPVNNLIIGITRSGKGELVVFPEIDIYSRAENKASMIIIDPKLELAPATIPVLERRGYEYHILNLVDPEYSMGYNPLSVILNEYKSGHEDDAKLLCGAFCYSIFNPDQASGDNKFFEDNSTTLLTALILAHVEDNIEADRFLNEKRKHEHDREFEKKKNKAIMELSKKDSATFHLQESIEKLFKINPQISDDEICEELKISKTQLENLKNSQKITINYQFEEYQDIFPNEKNINMFSIINAFSTLSSLRLNMNKTMLDVYFEERPEANTAKLLYASTGIAGEKTKGSIYSNMLTALKVFTYENIAKMTAESTLDMSRIGFGSKPIAIFIGMPDYDKSNYFLATAFIRQLYFTLAKMATHAPGGKCYREVIFLLDEFGNIPPIENMASIVTVCLGRNIRFNLIIQSYQQIFSLYGEDAKTIIDNCGNQLYILTSSNDTAEEFSKLIGSETITVANRTGKMFALNKERTEMQEERRLLDSTELTRLMPGEMIVNRVMKRQDLKGKPVIPYPICNMGEDHMKYRYQFLLDDFPSGNILYDSPDVRKVYESIRVSQQDRINNGYKETLIGEPQIITDIEIENTKHIDLNVRIWDGTEYLKGLEPISAIINQEDIGRLINILNLDAETQEKILSGKLKYRDIYKHIICLTKNVKTQRMGYKAYDILVGDKRKTYGIDAADKIWETLYKDIFFKESVEYLIPQKTKQRIRYM